MRVWECFQLFIEHNIVKQFFHSVSEAYFFPFSCIEKFLKSKVIEKKIGIKAVYDNKCKQKLDPLFNIVNMVNRKEKSTGNNSPKTTYLSILKPSIIKSP